MPDDADDILEGLLEPEVLERFAMTPAQRWAAAQKLWQQYVEMGGSLDPDPDPQSPFFDPEEPSPVPADGRAGVRLIRRGPI